MNDASDALKKTQCAVCENNPMNDPIRPYRYEASARPYAGIIRLGITTRLPQGHGKITARHSSRRGAGVKVQSNTRRNDGGSYFFTSTKFKFSERRQSAPPPTDDSKATARVTGSLRVALRAGRNRWKGVVCGRGRNPTLRLWPTIFSGKIDVFPGDRRSRLISRMPSVAPA